ncbi:MAG: hypothetical protein RIQ89_1381 [Bacteroidota bacterium]
MLALLILLSRIPFLFDGLGLDGDSWSVALVANRIKVTGAYEASRFPGYPIQELVCSLFAGRQYFFYNLATVVISTIGFLYFAATLRLLRFKYPFLATFALAFVPIIYINSVVLIDYLWALTFILAAHYYLLRRNIWLAGVLLGLAIGCRITSGALLIPFAVLVFTPQRPLNYNIIQIGKLILATILIGAFCFYPVYARYGDDFFAYYDVVYPTITKIIYKLFIETWGVIGCIGIALAIAALFLPDRITYRKYLFPRSVNEKYVVAWLIALDLFIIAFLRLPMESGYLIPAIPFLILILGKYLYEKAFIAFASILCIAPFLVSISPAGRADSPNFSIASIAFEAGEQQLKLDFLKGPVFAYQSRRENSLSYTRQVANSFDTISKPSLLLTGRWQNALLFQLPGVDKKFITLRDYLSEEQLLWYIGKEYQIYYLPGEEEYNNKKFSYDLSLFGVAPYIKVN